MTVGFGVIKDEKTERVRLGWKRSSMVVVVVVLVLLYGLDQQRRFTRFDEQRSMLRSGRSMV